MTEKLQGPVAADIHVSDGRTSVMEAGVDTKAIADAHLESPGVEACELLSGEGDFREIPLRQVGKGKWIAEEGFLDADYEPDLPIGLANGGFEIWGLVLADRLCALDFDPDRNPSVYEDAMPWLEEDSLDTCGQTTPHGGSHEIFVVPEDLRGRIPQHEFPEVSRLDIKPGGKGFLKTGYGYAWKEPDTFKPLPEKIADYYRDWNKRRERKDLVADRAKSGTVAAPQQGHVTPQMYMDAVDPVQEYWTWRKQCDSLTAGGAALDEVLAWCARGAKYDAGGDRAILKGSIRKGLEITSGWYATDYFRRTGNEFPKKSAENGGQWRSSKVRNKRERINLVINRYDVYNMFMRREMDIEDIAAAKNVDVRDVRRWLKQHTLTLGCPPLTSYVISVAKIGTILTDAGRYFRLKKPVRWVADKLGVHKSKAGRWRKKWKDNPLLGWNRKQVLRIVRQEERAKWRAEKRAKRQAANDPPRVQPVRVRALIRGYERRWNEEKQRYVYHRWERQVQGHWDRNWLEIDGEKTPTGRPKRKRASSVVWTWRLDAPEPKKGRWVFGSEEPGLKRFYS